MSLLTQENLSGITDTEKTELFKQIKENFINKLWPQDAQSYVPSLYRLPLFACAKLNPEETACNYHSDRIEALRG